MPDEVHGEEIVAVVVAGEGVPSAEEILAYGNEHLGRHKYPRRVEFVDALPLGPEPQGAQARAARSVREAAD